MGFFDLFKKKPALDTSRLVINLTENGLDVNGTNIVLPCNIDTLKCLFGSARKTVHPEKTTTTHGTGWEFTATAEAAQLYVIFP